jgi:hypothetical protein
MLQMDGEPLFAVDVGVRANKFRGHGMAADVLSTRIAAAVSEEPRRGLYRAVFESLA